MLSDRDRRVLFDALADRLGEWPAEKLMELLPPVGWSDVARQSDLVAVRGEIAELRGQIAELRGQIGAQFPKLVLANIASGVSIAGLVLAAGSLT